jgi:hypothetical protein
MSDTALKENVLKKWQKGVALLFALGILGLLLVMALGFATNSIFDQLIANNNGNSSAARTIAQSGLERIRNMLQNYAEKIRNIATPYNFRTDGIYGYSYSGDASVFNTNTGNTTAKSDKLQGFFSGYLYPSSTWSNDMTNYINWIYLQADGRLTGRMAYIILNRADLDPAKLVRLNVDESASPAPEVRLGAEANEINLRTIDSSINLTDAQKFNYSANGGVFNGNSWLDLPFLFDQFSPLAATLQAKFTRWFICNSKDSPEAYWIDANSDNVMTSSEQLHRFNLARTDWSAINTMGRIYNLLLLDSSYSGTPDINIFASPNVANPDDSTSGNLWTSESFDGKGIPWLALFGYNADGTLDTTSGATFGNNAAGVIARRRQIAANLVEYCKNPITGIASDSAISDSAGWLTTAPTYTGNKKTPYIDEIGVALETSATYTSVTISSVDYWRIAVSLNGYLLGKLIDIYTNPSAPWTTTPFTLKVKGNISYNVTVTDKDSSVISIGSAANQAFEYNLPSTSFNWLNGYGICLFTFDNGWPVICPSSGTCDIEQSKAPLTTVVNGVNVTIASAVLYYNNGTTNIFYDYSNINKTATLTPDLLNTNTDKTAQSTYFSFQTEDSRQNLNTGDWYVSSTAPAVCNSAVSSGSGAAYWKVQWENPTGSGYTGIVNEKGNPAVAYTDALSAAGGNPALCEADKETITDPAGGVLSTAYIRQAAMVSPWELGFIHRGAKWQTLNLHKYDDTKATKAITLSNGKTFTPGGGLYSAGDANILDQIKMNSSSKNYKIDLNNEFQDPNLSSRIVLYSLFKNIKSGSAMTDTAPGITGGTVISDSPDISNIIGGIVNRSGTGTNIYKTRTHIVNDIAAVEPILTTYATKARKDEIIGKMINLIDFDSYYTVILVAQTIRDVGGSGSSIPITKKLPGGTTGEVNAQLGKFDLTFDGTNYFYADEITSTLKIQALIHKKIDGSCEILSVKYIQ